jgi:putative redox protein
VTTPPAGKPPVHTTIFWTEEQSFRAETPKGAVLTMDCHARAAQSPPEALLSALGACAGVDIVEILKKRRTPVSRLEIRVVGQRVNAPAPRFHAIEVEYHIDGAGLEREPAEHTVNLAMNKYCTVKDSLDPSIAFTWRVVLNGERGPDHDATGRSA